MSGSTPQQLFCRIAEGLRRAVDETDKHCVYGTRQQLLEMAMDEVPELRDMVRGHSRETIFKGMCICVNRTGLSALSFKTDFADDKTVLAVYDLKRTNLRAVKLFMWNSLRAKSVEPRVRRKPRPKQKSSVVLAAIA